MTNLSRRMECEGEGERRSQTGNCRKRVEMHRSTCCHFPVHSFAHSFSEQGLVVFLRSQESFFPKAIESFDAERPKPKQGQPIGQDGVTPIRDRKSAIRSIEGDEEDGVATDRFHLFFFQCSGTSFVGSECRQESGRSSVSPVEGRR